ncbi:unnamed protein product [Pleuronectes platessa]|uniref:Ig-like domain-containing protein n=1 Tax=Pleuronectes platessa TaxID=8262 RepID=A0A9N7TSP2_PLEPL|nr:unnamed protein product [Pleuronectes platessa]
MITTSSTDLVEFISSVHLSCSSSGSLLSFLWLNGSSEVTASDRVQLTGGGTNLTIFNVTRYDQGTFRCRVVNPVSNGTSDPVFLSVSFGPENTSLSLSPSEHYYEVGSNVNLTCSAVSRPPAHFQWIGLSVSGPELPLLNMNMNQTGNYSCQAFNNKTNRKQTSQPAFISVLKRISGASVNSTTNQAVEGNSVNLTCEAAGSVFSRQWMKDGSDLILTNNMTLHTTNNVTGRSLTAVHALSVTVKQPPSCNSGCIAGITIACCLIVGLCAGGWYFVSRRRKQRKHLSHGDTRTGSAGGGSQNSLASSRNQDVTYTDINFLRKKDGGTVQLELEKNSEYAEVKVNNRLPAASSTDAHVEQMNEAAPQSGANSSQTEAQDPMT